MSNVKDILKVGDLVKFKFLEHRFTRIISTLDEVGFRSWDKLDTELMPTMSHWHFSEITVIAVCRESKQIWPTPLHEFWVVLSNNNSNYGEYSKRDLAEERLAFCKRIFFDLEFSIIHMREVRE